MAMVNKNRNLLILVYSLFSVLILIANIGDGLLNKLLLELSYVFGSADPSKVSTLFDIFKLVFNIIIYTTFGIIAFYLFLSCFDEIKYVIMYSVIVNIAVIVVSMIIKSFSGLNYFDYIVKIAFSMIGVLISFIFEFIKNKR